MNNILILGAHSDIAIAVAHRFAEAGYQIQLAARNINNLAADKSDIELRHQVNVTLHEFDALDTTSHSYFVEQLTILPNITVCAVGYMGVQAENEREIKEA